MKIYLNPGHAPNGNPDPGACGYGLRECDVVLDISKTVKTLLENRGHNVKMLQSDSLYAISQGANSWNADIFISIHCNAFNNFAQGTETCIYAANTHGATLGKHIQTEIVSALKTVDRGLKVRPDLYVLRTTNMPAVLVETAFIDNEHDGWLLANCKDDFAEAIAKGILKYFGQNFDAIDTNTTALNGKTYEQNDIDFLLNQGYSRAQALSLLDMSPKYSNVDIPAAVKYANSRINSLGYGNNGCTAWVRDFLLKANHPLGTLMKTGTQGNLMWVPNLMDYAKANNLWKTAEQGGAQGDVCLLETNACFYDGPDHVVIADGQGNYWGNSSSRNRIVYENIARDYGATAVHGYIATGIGLSVVAQGDSERDQSDVIADAGSTSYTNLAPNGLPYKQNDIDYLLNNGYSFDEAIEFLSKSAAYNEVRRTAPNGKTYEQNDIDYLINNGYNLEAAIYLLSQADKYRL